MTRTTKPNIYRLLMMLIIMVTCHTGLFSQLFKGDKFFEKHDYERALQAYEKAYVNNFSNSYLTRKIANSYRNLGDVETSLVWFKRTLEMDQSNQDDMLYYAEALKTVSMYNESQKWYAYYNKMRPDDSRALSHLKDEMYYENLRRDSTKFMIKRLEMNTELPEFGVARYGQKILFSSAGVENPGARTDFGLVENPYMDVYECTADELGELKDLQKLDKEINSKFHDGPVWYDESNDELYVTRNNEKKGKPVLDEQGRVNLKIYRSKKTEGKWAKAEELSFNSNEFSSAHPTLSLDGNTLYFSSNREGGIGGNDIYVCKRIGDDWSIPVNLGRPINSEGDEMFPSVGMDGRLYFASDGHVGLGALDIFSSEMNEGSWLIPTNLGYPINTNKDDFGYLPAENGKSGYFSSNRGSDAIQDDIYRFVRRNNIRIKAKFFERDTLVPNVNKLVRIEDFEGMLMGYFEQGEDNESAVDMDNEPGKYRLIVDGENYTKDTIDFTLDAGIEDELDLGIKELYKTTPILGSDNTFVIKAVASERSTGDPIPEFGVKIYDANSGELLAEKSTDAFGSIDFPYEPNKSYKLDFAKDDWTSKSIVIQGPSKGGTHDISYDHNLKFSRLGFIGEKLDIENIYYDFDKYNIRQDARPELDKVLSILNANATMNLTINSHTDSRGKASYNQWLSEKRAQSVVKYLVSKGIDQNRLVAIGHGENALTNVCGDYQPCGNTQHQDNRRTEFVITGI